MLIELGFRRLEAFLQGRKQRVVQREAAGAVVTGRPVAGVR
jgi:hypothetical protein